jgi:intracellular sulfur oxidation DsrE/DsrF family protein
MLSAIRLLIIALAFTNANFAIAGADEFMAGPIIKNHGKHAKVQQDFNFDKNTIFKVAFDISEQGKVGDVSRKIETLARFINMHVANGVPAKNIHLALVVHGKASFDLLEGQLYEEKFQQKNANNPLLQDLMKNQVTVYLCGQSAAYYNITNEMLAPGVKMALSAMTAHAVLQNNGYTVNPF